MSKVNDKKKKMAGKMSRKDTVEGEEFDGGLDRFSKADKNKEKKGRAEKHGKEPKGSWLE